MKLPAAEQVSLGDLKIEYERFFSVSLDMLCISSYDGHFKKVNPAFEAVLGFSAEELCTKSYLDFIHPDDIERTIKEVEKQMLTKQQVFSFENRYRCKDGSFKWLSWKSAPVGDFMYAAARDMTEHRLASEELKRAKEALEAANKELESFSYSVAHDLRAPVRSILGFGGLILEESATLGTEAKGHLDRMVGAGKRMGILIDGLLDLSRLAKKSLAKQSVDLSILAQDVLAEIQATDPERKVTFTVAPKLMAEGDPMLLKVVLSNLLGNSFKYTAKTGRPTEIELGSTDQDGARAFFVRDNGAGFEMKYADKLFGAFQRLHSEREFEGTGIGLATAHRIIQRHGGKIWASAEAGKGATFFFTV